MTGFFWIFAVVGLVASVGAVDYCSIKSCKGPHTMCKFPTMKPGAWCGQMAPIKLTQSEKKEILEAHNTFRAQVANGEETRGNPGPQPAGRIPPLEWDNELAKIAQRWANQCQTQTHDVCRDTDEFSVGQNIAVEGHSNGWTTTMTDLVKLWYDEVEFFDANTVSSFELHDNYGHYTQLVWGKTTRVGCGVAKFRDGIFFQTFLVCNYGPTGNKSINNKGLPVYETN